MIVNVLIDDGTAGLMEYYGNISTVVNRILQHGALGEIPLMDLPSVPLPDHNVKQYKVNVTEPNYLQLCEIYGTKSSRISLRRIIYWFMDNEKYIDFKWEADQVFVDKANLEIVELLAEIEAKLYKLYKLMPNNERLKTVNAEINTIKMEVWDA